LVYSALIGQMAQSVEIGLLCKYSALYVFNVQYVDEYKSQSFPEITTRLTFSGLYG